jgi:hypothetical protein
MDVLRYRYAAPLLLLAALTGCTQQQSSPDLKEQTAQATAEVKRDAQEVVAGIREGWSQDKPLDLNVATKEQLLSLPGVPTTNPEKWCHGTSCRKPNMTKFQIGSLPRNSVRLCPAV